MFFYDDETEFPVNSFDCIEKEYSDYDSRLFVSIEFVWPDIEVVCGCTYIMNFPNFKIYINRLYCIYFSVHH